MIEPGEECRHEGEKVDTVTDEDKTAEDAAEARLRILATRLRRSPRDAQEAEDLIRNTRLQTVRRELETAQVVLQTAYATHETAKMQKEYTRLILESVKTGTDNS